jgi:hypothetical protein
MIQTSRKQTRKKKKTNDILSLQTSIYNELASLPLRISEKSLHGEVFTPIKLIEEMCDAFPSSIWKKTDTVWLDPSTGIGHFPIVLFFRYMTGLTSVISDPVKRAKYIIEHILFMIEINPVNVRHCRALFKRLSPSATPHIHQGDFLTDSFPSSWPSHFDVVIGNPPYNTGGIKRKGTKRTHIPFTEKGLALLNPQGYIGYICPPSYRQAHTPMNRLFHHTPGYFVYLRILGPKETYQQFHIQGRVDLFLYHKLSTHKSPPTHIIDEYHIQNNIHLSLDRHIPNFGHTIFQKLYTLVDKYGHAEGYRTTTMTTVHANTFGCNGKHPLLHLIVEQGRRIYRTKKPHPLIGDSKLFINGLGIPYVYYDKNGKYGASQTPILILHPSPSLVKFIQSPLFVFIAWGLRLTGNNNLPYILDAVPLTSIQQVKLTAKELSWYQAHFVTPTYRDTDLLIPCQSQTKKKSQTQKKSQTKKRGNDVVDVMDDVDDVDDVLDE